MAGILAIRYPLLTTFVGILFQKKTLVGVYTLYIIVRHISFISFVITTTMGFVYVLKVSFTYLDNLCFSITLVSHSKCWFKSTLAQIYRLGSWCFQLTVGQSVNKYLFGTVTFPVQWTLYTRLIAWFPPQFQLALWHVNYFRFVVRQSQNIQSSQRAQVEKV